MRAIPGVLTFHRSGTPDLFPPLSEDITVLQNKPQLKRTGTLLVAIGLLPLLGACEWLTGVSRPQELRVELQSDDITTANLITSTFFLLIPDPECPTVCEETVQLVSSDTSVINLPFDQTFSFTEREQYFVEAYPVVAEEATLSMRVSIDGREWLDDFRTLAPFDDEGNQETLRFVYQFAELGINGPIR